jgi:glycosyltransferase involved in cell wall biosynthesis
MGMDISMKTVLDVTVCTHSRGGVGRWVRGLSYGLFLVNRNHVSLDIAETHPGLVSTVPGVTVAKPPAWMKLPLLRRIILAGGLLESTRASRIQKQLGMPDVIHLSGVQPEGNARRKVVTFFDDTPWASPESHTDSTLFYARQLKNLVDSGACVLAISSWARSAAQRLFSVPAERTGYAGGAAEEMFVPGEPELEVMKKFGLEPGNYFLHVGSFVPRKNIPFLVRSFGRADTGMKLVLAGAEKWGDTSVESTPGVVFLKSVSDNDLLSLYRGALALLFPSSTEGLGLPVLEAFACHTPVIASDGGALPETVGKNGLLLPVLEIEPWVEAMRETASGIILSSLREKAAAAPRDTWEDVGNRAMEFYRSIL